MNTNLLNLLTEVILVAAALVVLCAWVRLVLLRHKTKSLLLLSLLFLGLLLLLLRGVVRLPKPELVSEVMRNAGQICSEHTLCPGTMGVMPCLLLGEQASELAMCEGTELRAALLHGPLGLSCLLPAGRGITAQRAQPSAWAAAARNRTWMEIIAGIVGIATTSAASA